MPVAVSHTVMALLASSIAYTAPTSNSHYFSSLDWVPILQSSSSVYRRTYIWRVGTTTEDFWSLDKPNIYVGTILVMHRFMVPDQENKQENHMC